MDLASIRQEYLLASLTEEIAGENPLLFFHKWLAAAQHAGVDEVNAMALSTVDASGHPHCRIVLLKGIVDNTLVFYTNYHSQKGNEIEGNAAVSLLFFWKELQRQVRIDGQATKADAELSETYFNSRPRSSQLGAWASPQSEVIANREVLEQHEAAYASRYAGTPVPRPPHWGGYQVTPQKIEFWQGRSSRLHDRIAFEKNPNGIWKRNRLAPLKN